MASVLHAFMFVDSVVLAGGWVPTGAGSINTALSDSSDTTYAAQSGGSGELVVGLGNPTAVPAFAQITAVGFWVVANRPSGDGTTSFSLVTSTGGRLVFGPTLKASIDTYFSPQWSLKPDGTRWTTADVNALVWAAQDLGAGLAHAIDVVGLVYVNHAPTISSVGPTGTVSTSTQPLITWAYADSDGDACERVRVKVFSGSSSVGDPETETVRLVYDSGVLFQTATQHQMSEALANGDYRVAVKAADAGSNGSFGGWTQAGFTISVSLPPTPVWSVVENQDDQRYEILVAPGAGVSTDFFSVERSFPFGDWRPVFGAELVATGALTDEEANFTTTAAGWAAVTGVAATYPQRSTAQAFSGAASLVTRVASSGGIATIHVVRQLPVSQVIGYDLTFRARAGSAGTATVSAIVLWYDASGVSIGFSQVTPVSQVMSSTGWITVTDTLEAPLGAVTAELRVNFGSGTVTGVDYYVDAFSITPRVIDPEGPRAAHSGSLIDNDLFLGYRVRALRYLTPPNLAAGPWQLNIAGGFFQAGVVGDCKTYLKNPFTGTAGVVELNHVANFDTVSTDDMAALGAAGRANYAVFHGTVRGETGRLVLQFVGDAQWKAFEALRLAQAPLLLQTVYGDSDLEERWIELGPDRAKTNVTVPNQNQVQYRRATVALVQVDPPTL